MSNNMDKPSQDECGEESKKQGKAHWDDEALDAFIKICVVETIAGNRLGGHFSKQGWKNVIKKFSELTQRTYTQKQLKNKWTGLKKDWQLWTSLVGKETGLGWDPVKKTINASNEWWDKKVKETPEAAKFRTCGLKHADQLDILFKDIAVTGDGAWAPSQGFVHDVENELTRPTENSPEDVV
ncbi:L10-interacting MYB domain-containing protein-like [Prunus avium]|uniref:L10-interacting MYB domain-containing protein-like n=1 Tax=Prunus avium TaxID=42229 RepID=A0A6P5RV44_PRUAV|nr:L10-interacting MYB domain-containing protein-like [Prunus avium]